MVKRRGGVSCFVRFHESWRLGALPDRCRTYFPITSLSDESNMM